MAEAAPDREPGWPGPSPEVVERLLAFVERTSDLIGVTDDEGRIVYLNPAARQLLGPAGDGDLTTADLFTADVFDRYFDEIRPAIMRGEAWCGQLTALAADGRAIDVWASVVGEARPGGDVTWLVSSSRDITAWLDRQAELSRRASHDELTDLPGRGLLSERIGLALHRALRTGHPAAVLFVDVDDLKAVNDRLGHRVGDGLLIEVARRIGRAVRAIDTVARVGGDEFVVLLDGIGDPADAAATATRIRAAIETAPVRVDGAEVNVSVSIGVAVSAGETDAAELIARADGEMYTAKRDRRADDPAAGAVAGPGASAAIAGRRGVRSLAHEVAVAVTQRAIEPWFQRVVRVDGGVEGYQALARWIEEDGGVVTAASFVGAVDRAGVAFSVDLTVLREAARAVAGLDRPDRRDRRLWAHVSARFLGTPGAAHFVEEVLEHTGMAAGRLSLVLPPGFGMTARSVGRGEPGGPGEPHGPGRPGGSSEPDGSRRPGGSGGPDGSGVAAGIGPAPGPEPPDEVLRRLRGLGVRLAASVPDADTLAALDAAPDWPLVDELRLGRGVLAMVRSGAAPLSAVVTRARAAGLPVQVAGVETPADRDRAVALGADLLSGFHLGAVARTPT